MKKNLPFEKLRRNDLYQVFVFSCPVNFPYSFARHPWVVLNKKGVLSRWEIFWQKDRAAPSWGHLHKDFYPPTQGTRITRFAKKTPFWPSRVDTYIEGEEGSLAEKIVSFIESSPEKYPYCYKYSLFGPNSVTYAQYMLKQFSKSGLRLPWNSFSWLFAR